LQDKTFLSNRQWFQIETEVESAMNLQLQKADLRPPETVSAGRDSAGLSRLTALIGDLYAAINPWRTLAQMLERAIGGYARPRLRYRRLSTSPHPSPTRAWVTL